MKANIRPNIRDIIISLTEREATAAMFYATFKKTLHVVMLTKFENSVLCFTGVLRKQGTGKKTASDKVVRLRHKKSNYIFTSDSIKEIGVECIESDFVYEGNLSVSEMEKSRIVFNYGISNMVDKTSNSLKKITNAMKQSIEQEITGANKNIDVKVASQVEVADVEDEDVPEVIEETLLDKLVAASDRMTVGIVKELTEKLIDIDFDESIINELETLDSKYVYAQELCNKRYNSFLKKKFAEKQILLIEEEIQALQRNMNCLNKMLEESIKSMEDDTTTINKISSEITSTYNNIYGKINDAKVIAAAEKKAAEITANLSDAEKEALLKALGMTVSTEVLSDAVGTADINVSLIDGNTITDKDGSWSWAEVKSHLVDVAQHRASASLKILEFIKAQNLSRKELESKLTQRYASVAIDEMAKVGLYKKRENNSSAMTPEQRKQRAAKAAASRKRNLAAKLAVLENSAK